MAIPIPDDVRELLEAANYVHLSTLRADGSPRTGCVGRGSDRVCFVIAVERATQRTLRFVHDPS